MKLIHLLVGWQVHNSITNVTWNARWDICQIGWIYFMYSFGKEPIRKCLEREDPFLKKQTKNLTGDWMNDFYWGNMMSCDAPQCLTKLLLQAASPEWNINKINKK